MAVTISLPVRCNYNIKTLSVTGLKREAPILTALKSYTVTRGPVRLWLLHLLLCSR